jgi:serine protease
LNFRFLTTWFRAPSRRSGTVLLTLLSALLASCGTGSSSSSSGAPPGPAAFQCPVEAEGPYSINGTLTVAPGGMLDSDSRSAGQPRVDNGSFASAQLIPNPVVIGGAASFGAPIDTNDYFVVELQAGDTIVMQVGDAGEFCDATGFCEYNDLDLFLYDSAQVLVGFSESSGQVESLQVSEAGLYYIEVRVWEGASGYALRIAPDAGTATATNALEQDFVPGEILLQYHQTESGLPPVTAASAAAGELEQLAGTPGQVQRMRMVPQVFASALSDDDDSQMQFRSPEQAQKYATLRAIKRLKRDATVEHASPNYLWKPTAVTPNDPFFEYSADPNVAFQWHYQDSDVIVGGINLPDAWQVTTGNENVIVAVIDTGILPNHPDFFSVDLVSQLVAGFDFVSDPARAADGNGIDNDPTDAGDFWHGTHVAGTIGAATDNGIGVAGVAWNAKIMPLRALGPDDGTFYDIMQAMRYAAGLPNDSNTVPVQRADVINLSLGGVLIAPDQFQQELVDEVREAGVIVIAAAGNRSSSSAFYPASYDGVVSVSATGRDAAVASYSNFGPTVDVAAPGGSGAVARNYWVLSTWDSSQYAWLQGTSMASPHVAGVAALMQSVRLDSGQPLLTPEEFDFLLATGELARDLGPVGRDDLYGYGLIDAAKAVTAAMSDPEPTPILSVSPGSIDFGTNINAAVLAVRNVGGGPGELGVTISQSSITCGDGWLAIEPDDPLSAGGGLGIYTLRADRTGLPPGDCEAQIVIMPFAEHVNPPAVEQQSVTVTMTVSDSPFMSDIGELIVFLVDPAEPFAILTALPQPSVDSTIGIYELPNIPGGCYCVVASTDIDGDGHYGEISEAWGISGNSSCGSGSPAIIELEADVTVDFDVSFD